MKKCVVYLIVLMCLGMMSPFGVTQAQEKEEPAPQLSVSTADYYLKQWESQVKGLDGKRVKLSGTGKRALKEISALRKSHPNDPKVQALFERAKAALRLSKGILVEITPEMLAYRENQKKSVNIFNKVAADSWKTALADKQLIDTSPAPNPEEVSSSSMKGKDVLLKGVKYYDNTFLHNGRPYIAVGSPSAGFFFIDAGHRDFRGAAEAIRRYENQISPEIPQEWEMLGKISRAAVMVPSSSKDDAFNEAYAGWVVEVSHIRVPGYTLAMKDPSHETYGSYAGEKEALKLLKSSYSVTEIPVDVTPEQMIELLETALKEKNYDLYLQIIHPLNQQTQFQRAWNRRHYEFFQKSLHTGRYVHMQPYKVDPINIIQGGSNDEDLESEFMDDDLKEQLDSSRLPKVERVTVWVRTFDEKGRMLETASPVTLERREDDKVYRWYMISGYSF